MFKLLKWILGIVIFILVISIVLAFYENFNGGPWYTYVNFEHERAIVGAEHSGLTPGWIQTVSSIMTPFLKIGHLIADIFF